MIIDPVKFILVYSIIAFTVFLLLSNIIYFLRNFWK